MFNGDFQKMKRFFCHNYINAKEPLTKCSPDVQKCPACVVVIIFLFSVLLP